LPQLTQTEFDALLWACDANFVRGEDSLVRALWAGTPLVWQIYPQDDGAHHDKLAAFLDAIDASPVLRDWHMAWNAPAHINPDEHPHDDGPTHRLPPLDALCADTTIDRARTRLTSQDDLCTQLMQFVAKQKPAKM
jgi:uncharacterized repeat protein (TIGR03837 family)